MRLVHLCCLLALALPCGLGAAEGDGAKHHEAKKEGADAMPAGSKGVSQGTIASLEKGKLILTTADGDLLFMPHWKGGMPKDGGGLDQATMETLAGFKVGDQVKISWVWQERRRIETIQKQ